MADDNKPLKYMRYAIGEIVLVVIGILIALQLNNYKENKNKSDLGYKYLLEMKNEVLNDIFKMDRYIRNLNKNIKKHEAALNTKNINKLPLDSIYMIINPITIDLKVSELTFNKMNNLGLTSLTKNEKLSKKISRYYAYEIMFMKLYLDDYSGHYKKYQDFLILKQDAIDFSVDASEEFEFPELYQQTREELNNENRINSIQFITSIRGRMLIIKDLKEKKDLLRNINYTNEQSKIFVESIYDELKSNNPQIVPLPDFPSKVDFKEISLSQDILKKYIGTYTYTLTSGTNDRLNVLIEEKSFYVQFIGGSKFEIFPYEEDKFFSKRMFLQFEFNKDKGEIVSLTQKVNGKKMEWIKTK